MSYNVLVTAISGDVGNSILKCLQDCDIVNCLYGCDIYEHPCGKNKVEKFYRVSPCKEEDLYIGQLLSICEEENIKVIIPVNEYEIVVLNKRREEFQKRGIKLLLHNQNAYDLFFDKAKTQVLLRELNLPYIPTYYSNEYSGQLDFPLVIKDTFGCGSKSLYVAQNELDLKSKLKKRGGIKQIVQKYVGSENSEYTVPVFSGDGGKTIVYLPLRRTLSKEGYTNFIELANEKYFGQIENICLSIASHIRLRGSIDLQMREENGTFYVFECNPRLSGTVNFRRLLGFDDAKWWLQALEKDLQIDYKIPVKSFAGVREINEIILWN